MIKKNLYRTNLRKIFFNSFLAVLSALILVLIIVNARSLTSNFLSSVIELRDQPVEESDNITFLDSLGENSLSQEEKEEIMMQVEASSTNSLSEEEKLRILESLK